MSLSLRRMKINRVYLLSFAIPLLWRGLPCGDKRRHVTFDAQIQMLHSCIRHRQTNKHARAHTKFKLEKERERGIRIIKEKHPLQAEIIEYDKFIYHIFVHIFVYTRVNMFL